MSTCRLLVDPQAIARASDGKFALEFARIENHLYGEIRFEMYLKKRCSSV
jgi:hypothetical protein